jgi:2-oxoglutarate dehydrogenase E1 component
LACLDPLAACPTSHPLLDLAAFDLTPADLEREVYAPEFGDGAPVSLGRVRDVLRETYCRAVGVEYMHLQDPQEREWLRARMEGSRNHTPVAEALRRELWTELVQASRFEQFLGKRYLGQTRFSLEGAEVMLPLLRTLCRDAAGHGVEKVVLGMAHRGRLNVHVHLLGKSYHELFCQFEASYDPDGVPGGGDVKYHSGYAGGVAVGEGASVRVIMPENPSHLEAVNPVVEGVARAFQDRLGSDGARRVLPVLIHGDAAFPGQGIVAETLNLARLEGYATGGSLHLILNNQIGYTTLPADARSTRYATDLAKMLMVPIFHVHGEHPEAVLHAGRLALEYRTAFGKDAVLDLVCYRRHGHNEGDEPYFTQPLMYRRIRERPPLYQSYGEELLGAGVLEAGAVAVAEQAADRALAAGYEAAKGEGCVWVPPVRWHGWEGIGSRYSHEAVETGYDEGELLALHRRLLAVPEGFSLHPKLERIFQRRQQAMEADGAVDWAGAEALAFATLVEQGVTVRLSGEDSRRGTFSHRHSVWFDTETGATHCPLAAVAGEGASFYVFDSPLSEAGVLGFEYGYSAVDPASLVLWEAQYGDFANGAQVIVDQFLASGEAKWQRANGVTLLLPHGYEGQGPDHSTARFERFLQQCAEDNLQVCQPTTPAQYFHLLRRQVMRPFRKPLVVLTPKSLLRHPEVVSNLGALSRGWFREVLPDPETHETAPCRVLLCSGKVYYDLLKRRRERALGDVAVLRLEQFYPFPLEQLREVDVACQSSPEWCWVQEEPENMGGWRFLAPHLEAALGRPGHYIGRQASASPATGFPFIHREEQEAILAEALG